MSHNRRLAALECAKQQQEAASEPPPDLSMETLIFGWRSRCFVVDAGNFRPYLPNFPDPYWKNATTWLNQFKAQNRVTAAELIQEILTYESEHERTIDKVRKSIPPED